MDHYKFFQNRACEYYPCHTGADPDKFNCLFCYCPLYALADRCGGNFRYTEAGIKDCSDCKIPHDPASYEYMISRMEAVLMLAKKETYTPEKLDFF